ncbi:TPA: hypothetical protein ACH3X2_009716 [Trebouxia sp. C0005]
MSPEQGNVHGNDAKGCGLMRSTSPAWLPKTILLNSEQNTLRRLSTEQFAESQADEDLKAGMQNPSSSNSPAASAAPAARNNVQDCPPRVSLRSTLKYISAHL